MDIEMIGRNPELSKLVMDMLDAFHITHDRAIPQEMMDQLVAEGAAYRIDPMHVQSVMVYPGVGGSYGHLLPLNEVTRQLMQQVGWDVPKSVSEGLLKLIAQEVEVMG